MSRVEAVEQAVEALDTEELADFRAWLAEYDWTVWDQELKRDAMSGRLNPLADKALGDHAADNTNPL
jgi:hypothetical protein